MRVRIVFDENVREDEPVYVISKAAELAGMHPQTLRQYDRLGLVSPRRTSGRGRRYSKRNVVQLIEIQRLSHEEGINLAGIKRIMDLEDQVRSLESRVELLAAQVNPGSRVFMAGAEGDVVSQRRKGFLRKRSPKVSGVEESAISAERLAAGFPERRVRGVLNAPQRPLQLTARVEEISRARFYDLDTEDSEAQSAHNAPLGNSANTLRNGRAVIVWTPDE